MTAALEPSGDGSTPADTTRWLSAAAALHALAVSADAFAAPEHFAEAVAVLDAPGSTFAVSAVARRVAMMDAQLAQLAATSEEGPFEELRAETRQVVAMADDALADARCIEVIAGDPQRYVSIYLTYGVFPYRRLADGIARAGFLAAVSACDREGRAGELSGRIVEHARMLLDRADTLTAAARGATCLGDLLSDVHEALPLYVAGSHLLRWTQELADGRGDGHDPGSPSELAILEQHWVACAGCVASVFDTVVAQVVSFAFLGTAGEPLRDAAGAAIRRACDRLAFMPSRVRASWDEVAAGIPASVTVPYGSASMELAGRLANALWEAFDAAFEDRPLVDIAHAARERSVSLVSFRAEGTLSGWDGDLVATRPEECRSALGKGRACLQRGQFGRAARAFAAARRAADAPTRESATASLALARARLGDAAAHAPPRPAPTRGTRRSR